MITMYLLKVCLVIRLLAVVVDLRRLSPTSFYNYLSLIIYEVLDFLCLLYLSATALPTENVRTREQNTRRIQVITCSRQFVPLQKRHPAE